MKFTSSASAALVAFLIRSAGAAPQHVDLVVSFKTEMTLESPSTDTMSSQLPSSAGTTSAMSTALTTSDIPSTMASASMSGATPVSSGTTVASSTPTSSDVMSSTMMTSTSGSPTITSPGMSVTSTSSMTDSPIASSSTPSGTESALPTPSSSDSCPTDSDESAFILPLTFDNKYDDRDNFFDKALCSASNGPSPHYFRLC
ncbi:hypothetical protein EW146_g7965 [Bondarzewia mesenterica]|uniref:REJ domain-containing protein n=1 Tax=Bondarzewia mesenterica TaxID=1095465 RepID=A0A4S4LJX3_9AGAM|nr:hypothetical protein EW146_g7965 [Bondarzewia mesenterica]